MKMKNRHWNLYQEEFQRQKADLAESDALLEAEIEVMQKAKAYISDLRARNKRQENMIATLIEVMQKAKAYISDLQARNKRQESMITTLQKEISRLRTLATNQSESLAQQELTLQRTVLANRNLREQIYRAGMGR